MPDPIYMTAAMIEENFAAARAEFEEKFAKERASAEKVKLPNGTFTFNFSKKWYWGEDNTRATLHISEKAFARMMLFVQTTTQEVGWHGTIVRDPENPTSFCLEDVFLYPQTVTGSTIDANAGEYDLWAVRDVPLETFNKMRFHGHSHVNMDTTPSSTDMDFRARLIQQFKDGFYVFLIINKSLKINVQIYDFDNNQLFQDKEVDVIIGDDMAAKVKEDRDKMVTTSTYGSSYYKNGVPSAGSNAKGKSYGSYAGGWSGYYDDDDDDAMDALGYYWDHIKGYWRSKGVK